MAKYKNQKIGTLRDSSYKRIFEKRQVDFIKIRRTITFEDLKRVNINIIDTREWRVGDALHRLSYEFYGRIDYWWVIALVNNKPTDAHFTIGDIIKIPRNPDVMNNILENS